MGGKKDEEKASVKVNQPIWRNSFQIISRKLPPKQQFKFPILKHSNNSQKQKTTLKYSSSHLNFSAQSGTWYRMQNVYHHISMETITSQNFQSELDSAQDESKGCHIESVFLWTNVAFKSKHKCQNWIPDKIVLRWGQFPLHWLHNPPRSTSYRTSGLTPFRNL